MSKRRPPSTLVRVGDDILARVAKEIKNGSTMRDKVEAAILRGLDQQIHFLGKAKPLLDYIEQHEKKRRKKN